MTCFTRKSIVVRTMNYITFSLFGVKWESEVANRATILCNTATQISGNYYATQNANSQLGAIFLLPTIDHSQVIIRISSWCLELHT